MMQLLTDFADQEVILPVAMLALIGLLLSGWRRAALAWAVVVPVTLLLVLVGKMFTLTCAPSFLGISDLRSPSGHAASAALVYGGLVALLCPFAGRRATVLLAPSFFAMIIGASRIALGVHTLWDVLTGGAIGIGGAWSLVWLAGPRPATRRHSWALPAVLALTAGLLHGGHMEVEARIRHYARSVWPFRVCDEIPGASSTHTQDPALGSAASALVKTRNP